MIQNHYEEPCYALYDRRIKGPAYATATDVINTSRIKRWKPADDGRRIGACNIDYCYIDYDTKNNNIDPMMVGQDCSTNNPMFGNVSFVTSVFEDSSMDKTRTFPYNKCVFKVNTSNITLDKKQSFWDKVNGMKCDIQVADYNNQILMFTQSLKECKEYLAWLKEEYQRLFFAHEGAVATRQKYEHFLAMCRKRYSILQKENEDVTIDYLKQYNVFLGFMEDCKKKIPWLVKHANYWEEHYNALYSSNVIAESNLASVVDTIKENGKLYELRIAAFDNMKLQLEVLLGYNKDLNKQLEEMIDIHMKCKVALNMCQERISNCDDLRTRKTTELKTTIDSLRVCQEGLAHCGVELQKLIEENAWERAEYNIVLSKYEKCSEDLRMCMFTKQQQQDLKEKQDDYLTKLKIRLEECMKRRGEVGTLLDATDLARTNLDYQRQQADATQSAIIEVNRDAYNASSASLAACAGNKLATLPNDPPYPTPGITIDLTGDKNKEEPMAASGSNAGSNAAVPFKWRLELKDTGGDTFIREGGPDGATYTTSDIGFGPDMYTLSSTGGEAKVTFSPWGQEFTNGSANFGNKDINSVRVDKKT